MLDESKIIEIIRRVQNESEYEFNGAAALARVMHLIAEANKPLSAHAGEVVAEFVKIQKITMINELRTRTGGGLKECKEEIDDALLAFLTEELRKAQDIVNHRDDHYSSTVFDYNSPPASAWPNG
jgi:ribosomal protein L7/L12